MRTFYNIVAVWRPEACNSIKTENVAQKFPCEFSKDFKETYSVEQLGMIASEKSLKLDSHLPENFFDLLHW